MIGSLIPFSALLFTLFCSLFILSPNFVQFQRQSNSSSSGGGYSKSTATSPYQSQLYDSWKTEWDGYYDDHFRAGPGGGGGSGAAAAAAANSGYSSYNYSNNGSNTYMTKGGRRPSYDDDF